MSGTKAGGLKARKTNLEKYGKDFYREIGRKGGRNGHTGGFAANPELAKLAGAKGGRISRRGPAKRIKELSAEKAQKPKAEEPKKTWWGKLWGRENG